MIKTEVAIVGAGISGLYLSMLLEQKNINYLTLEQRTKIGKYGNRVINKEVFQMLKLTEEKTIKNIKEINFYSPSEFKISKKSLDTRGYVINLKNVEENIYNLINNKNNIKFSNFVSQIRPENNLLISNKETINAEIIVLAFGALQDKLRTNLKITNPKKVFCYGIEIKAEDIVSVILENNIAKGFYGWIIPLQKGLIEIGFGETYNDFNIDTTIVRRKLYSLPYLRKYKNYKLLKENSGFIPISSVNKKAGENWILIGDASGGEPLMGGSIHKSIDEALIASEIIEKFINKKINSLVEYEKLWNEKLANDYKIQEKIRNMINNSSNEEFDFIFKKLQNKEIKGKGLINDLFKNIIINLKEIKNIK